MGTESSLVPYSTRVRDDDGSYDVDRHYIFRTASPCNRRSM